MARIYQFVRREMSLTSDQKWEHVKTFYKLQKYLKPQQRLSEEQIAFLWDKMKKLYVEMEAYFEQNNKLARELHRDS